MADIVCPEHGPESPETHNCHGLLISLGSRSNRFFVETSAARPSMVETQQGIGRNSGTPRRSLMRYSIRG